MEIKNAVIKSTFLGREDHGIFTFYLGCDTDGLFRQVGGYCLDYKDKDSGKYIYFPNSLRLINEILSVIGCNSWEGLRKRYIRLMIDGSSVKGIGHIIEDKWVIFSEVLNDDSSGNISKSS